MTIKAQLKESASIPEVIYLLWDNGVFIGRITCVKSAIHFAERAYKGKLKVEIRMLTKDKLIPVTLEDLKENLKKENYRLGVLKRQETMKRNKIAKQAVANGIPVEAYGAFA